MNNVEKHDFEVTIFTFIVQKSIFWTKKILVQLAIQVAHC